MQLFEALGLDLRTLLAQLVNFSVLIFVLWRFAYKPVFNILEERRLKISQGVQDSEEAGQKLAQAEAEKKEIIAIARKEANDIIEEARKKAELRYQEIIDKSKTDLKVVMESEKEKIKAERNSAIKDVKQAAAQMIGAALAKILPEVAGQESDAAMISKALKELE